VGRLTGFSRSDRGPTLHERTIALRDLEEERFLYGHLDRNLHVLRRLHGVEAVSRGGQLRLKGHAEALEDACDTVERALELIRDGGIDDPHDVERLFRERFEERRAEGPRESRGPEPRDGVRPPPPAAAAPSAPREAPRGERRERDDRAVAGAAEAPRAVQARGRNQQAYLDAIERHTVTFGIGPAGTGKSFLAVASAVKLLRAAQYRKIVLCRPAVEAGESLGFLPGDLKDKINPYLRPLYDALHQLLPRATLQRYLDEEIIEILPLAYMRGRTLEGAFIILDEAQNATIPQTKMFLTRLGERSKMVVTGDLTQTDLPRSKASGLVHAVRILQGVRDVAFCRFANHDIVRHPVVRDIIRAYSADEGEEEEPADEAAPPSAAPAVAPRESRPDEGHGFGAGIFEGDTARDDRHGGRDRGARRPSRDRDHRPPPRGGRGRR
jgi:phosphate starvation-inducible PhoH-like protein